MLDHMLAAKAFVLVAQTLSFTKAAEILGLSVAVISRQISGLEKQTGKRLLHRTTRHVSLTSEGTALLQRFQAFLSEADLLFSPESLYQTNRTLRIAASMPFFDMQIVELLAAFQQKHPQLNLNFELTSQPLDLVRGSVDIGFQEGSEVAEGYIARPIGSIESWMCASPDYLAQAGTPRSLDELQQHRLLSIASCHKFWQFVRLERPNEIISLKVNPCFTSNYSQAMLTMCLAGNGITFQPVIATKDLVQQGRLCVVLPEFRGNPHIVYAAVASRLNLSPIVRQLLEFIAQAMPKITSAHDITS